VLVVDGGRAPLAALGELLANEAHRRGIAGIVVDGYVRDRSGLPDLPIWARGTVPNAGRNDVAPRVAEPVLVGGVRVTPGELVLADDDGIVVAPADQLEAALERAEAIERTEAAVLAGIRRGEDLIAMTNLVEHVARLRAGETSSLQINPAT
jgi:4-hydroxy-4-methyl-2-oxoglutarate aldolase